MARTTGTKGIDGFGFPGTAIAVVGFTGTTSVAAGIILYTPGPVIVITAITTAIMIAAMIAAMIVTTIAAGIAIKSHGAWRSVGADVTVV